MSPTCTVHDAISSTDILSFLALINSTVFLLCVHEYYIVVIFYLFAFKETAYLLIGNIFFIGIGANIVRVQGIDDFFVAQHAAVRLFGWLNFAHKQFTQPGRIGAIFAYHRCGRKCPVPYERKKKYPLFHYFLRSYARAYDLYQINFIDLWPSYAYTFCYHFSDMTSFLAHLKNEQNANKKKQSFYLVACAMRFGDFCIRRTTESNIFANYYICCTCTTTKKILRTRHKKYRQRLFLRGWWMGSLLMMMVVVTAHLPTIAFFTVVVVSE